MPGLFQSPLENAGAENASTDSIFKTVLIFGPTAVGKTALLEAPVFSKSEIINADSMQVYRGMDIGTAKPEPGFLSRVKHHLIDIREPREQFHVGDFVELADKLVEEISSRGRLPVICGGTGFYFKNFIYGLPEAPPSYENIRLRLQEEFKQSGSGPLLERLEQVDPESAARINKNDNYRILRALEVYESTGRPLSSFAVPNEPRPQYKTLLIGLNRSREELYERINLRVDLMFKQGIEAEVARLRSEGCTESDPGMKGIGYREFFTASENSLDNKQLRELIKRNSRRYAKRQITWFRQLESIHWYSPEDVEGISELINAFLDT